MSRKRNNDAPTVPEGLCTACSTESCAQHRPKRNKKQPEPEIIRLTNEAEHPIPGFTITNLSEADIRQLYDGNVPAWIRDTAAFWLRDHPKPSDVMPASCDPEFERKAS
jgi:hypothetical protein